MNKKLIALAVTGACAVPAAMAQTANPVTLYGRVYDTLESIEASGGPSTAASVPRRTRIDDQSSLLGVRGTEDLGGGLKAFFQLETAFKADQNDTGFAQRNSAVGLQGGWGSILMGRWDMPMKTTVIAIDPFGDLTIGGYTGVMADQKNFDVRAQNVVQYWSPSWSGVAVRLATTTTETKTTTATPKNYGASVTYTGGPLYLVFAYEAHKDATSANNAASGAVTSSGLNPVPGADEKGYALGGTFNISAFKIGALYQKFKKGGPATLAKDDQKAWMLNGIYTLGNHQFIYQYMQSKDGRLLTATTDEPDCHSHNLGYQYNFSKRTFFLAQYTKVSNNITASCNFGNTRLAASAGQDLKGFAVGLRHIF